MEVSVKGRVVSRVRKMKNRKGQDEQPRHEQEGAHWQGWPLAGVRARVRVRVRVSSRTLGPGKYEKV